MSTEMSRDHSFGRYDECAYVLSHPEVFTVEHATYRGAEKIRGRRGVQLIDGAPHRRLHAFLTKYFASREGEVRRSLIRPLVEAAIDESAGNPELEVLNDLAAPLSERVITAVLGLPHENPNFMVALAEWRDSIAPWVATQGESSNERERALAASSRLQEEAMPTIRFRKGAPKVDLVSALWHIGPTIFHDWSEDDVFDQCRIMLLAGSEGVAQLISTAIHLALDAHRLRVYLSERNRHAASALIEYACHIYPPAQLRPRVANRSTTVGGRQIRIGDRLCPDVVAANRDPAHYTRATATTSRHLAFNIGERYCSGAPLARAEAEETLVAFFERFPDCERPKGCPPAELRGLLFVGFSPVHVWLAPSGMLGERDVQAKGADAAC